MPRDEIELMNLFIIRGLPGAGKTTLAEHLKLPIIESDDYEPIERDVCAYKPFHNRHRFAQCVRRAEKILKASDCVVSNVFCTLATMSRYRDLAQRKNHRVTIIDLFDAGLPDHQLALRCKHGLLPQEIRMIRNHWEFAYSHFGSKNAEPIT